MFMNKLHTVLLLAAGLTGFLVRRQSNIVLAISATGTSVALMHPNGRVYQYGSRVEIRTNDTEGNCK